MTRKIALSLALFASLGMTACTVDAPTPEDFNYSFLDELPGASSAFNELPFRAPADAHIIVSFGDSDQGIDDVPSSAVEVMLAIDTVRVSTVDEEGNTQWRTIRKDTVELDLLQLADGSLEQLADGPFSAGQYTGLAIEFEDAWVVAPGGKKSRIELPGRKLVIEEEFELYPDASTEFVVNFGGLRGLRNHLGRWSTTPNVVYAVQND